MSRNRKHRTLKIDVDTAFSDRLLRFGKSLPGIINSSMGDVAHDMATYIRSNFLSGKPLAIISRETHESTRAYQAKKGERGWFVDFGVGVKGHLNYLYRWRGTRRDFMTHGSRRYEAEGSYMKLVEENLERMGRRLEVM